MNAIEGINNNPQKRNFLAGCNARTPITDLKLGHIGVWASHGKDERLGRLYCTTTET